MSRSLAVPVVFILGCVAGGAASQLVVRPARAGSTAPRWEYACGVDTTDKQLADAGAQGWHLVTAVPVQQGPFGKVEARYCLERPLP